jgi:DEAD/DEAH box helicase domain-containing protein
MPAACLPDILHILHRVGLPPLEAVTLPSKQAAYADVPEQLAPQLRSELSLLYPAGLYSHQARAIAVVAAGEDVCLATPTASGKSLVFMSASVDLLLRDRSARILALYPAKALIQDQLDKWQAFLARRSSPISV